MTLQTFSPPCNPDVGSGKKTTARTLTAKLGDGYEQRGKDGLNTIGRSLSLKWTLLTESQAYALDNFFIEHEGYKAFLWKAPRDTVTRKWKCESWDNPWDTGTTDTFSATFTQVYDL